MKTLKALVAITLAAIALSAAGTVQAAGFHDNDLLTPYHVLVAPGAPTNTASGAIYPYNADNGSDIWEDSGATTVLTAPIACLVANTPCAVIAATTGKKIRVLGWVIFSSIANSTVQWQDETGTPVKESGVMTFAANGQSIVPPTRYGVIDTAASAALDVNIAGTSDVVGGTVTYCLH